MGLKSSIIVTPYLISRHYYVHYEADRWLTTTVRLRELSWHSVIRCVCVWSVQMSTVPLNPSFHQLQVACSGRYQGYAALNCSANELLYSRHMTHSDQSTCRACMATKAVEKKSWRKKVSFIQPSELATRADVIQARIRRIASNTSDQIQRPFDVSNRT